MQFEIEVEKNEVGLFVARAVAHDVSATGRTEQEALARVMDALTLHFKTRRAT